MLAAAPVDWTAPLEVPVAEPLVLLAPLLAVEKRRESVEELPDLGFVEMVVHTVRAGASLGGRAARGSSTGGARCRVGGLGNSAGGREEVGAVALLLTVGVLLGVGRRASALGAGSDTAVGVVGLVVAGAGDVVALSNAADVVGIACDKDALELASGIEAGFRELQLTLGSALSLSAKSGGRRDRGGGGVRGGSQGQQGGEGDQVELHFGDGASGLRKRE
jgi:hypothetical protein